MSLYSPPVRACKPPTAAKACGTTFHAQPDYLAGIKQLPFVYFVVFVVFEDLHFPGIILREMLNKQTPLFPRRLIVPFASICIEMHSAQRLSFYTCCHHFFPPLILLYIYLHKSLCTLLSLSHPVL